MAVSDLYKDKHRDKARVEVYSSVTAWHMSATAGARQSQD